jgi:hypothetical protein
VVKLPTAEGFTIYNVDSDRMIWAPSNKDLSTLVNKFLSVSCSHFTDRFTSMYAFLTATKAR